MSSGLGDAPMRNIPRFFGEDYNARGKRVGKAHSLLIKVHPFFAHTFIPLSHVTSLPLPRPIGRKSFAQVYSVDRIIARRVDERI